MLKIEERDLEILARTIYGEAGTAPRLLDQ